MPARPTATASAAATGQVPRLEDAAYEFLLELLDTPSPSGYEGPAGDAFVRYGSSFGSVRTDAIGNCYVTVNEGAPSTVMLVGHLDEIGFVITESTSEGMLKVAAVGGWDACVAMGQRVRILTDGGVVPGVVGSRSIDEMIAGDRTIPRIRDLWIDIGARDREQADAMVRPGDPVVLDTRPLELPNRRIASRSVDNRIGCFVALEAARQCAGLGVEVVATGVVCEETVGFGARAAAYSTRPDVACAIDVTPCSEVPGDFNFETELGKGPVLSYGASVRSRVANEMLEYATSRDIDVQLVGLAGSTWTDADEMVRAAGGVPVGLLSIPTRYVHSPVEVFALDDVEAAIAVLCGWIRMRGEGA